MDKNPIVVEETINASVEKVWQALTNKDQMKEWYFDIPDFELKIGNVFNFYEPGENKKYHHRGTIKEIILNKKLKHTWTHPSHSKGESILTWELDSLGNATKVKLTHDGIEQFADAGKNFEKESYEAGWKEIVGESLKNYLEKS
jgi:uncharacterized protein YndB with AHSA1/START domain